MPKIELACSNGGLARGKQSQSQAAAVMADYTKEIEGGN